MEFLYILQRQRKSKYLEVPKTPKLSNRGGGQIFTNMINKSINICYIHQIYCFYIVHSQMASVFAKYLLPTTEK